MKTTCLLYAGLLLFSAAANAALHDRGAGLIYDDVLDVTWLQDANYAKTTGVTSNGRMSWQDAVNWAASLDYFDAVRNVTYSNWRLPDVSPVNGSVFNLVTSYDASTDVGFADENGWIDINDQIASEFGHLYYATLADAAQCQSHSVPLDSCVANPGWPNHNRGPFTGVENGRYWTSQTLTDTEGANQYLQFNMGSGEQVNIGSGGSLWYVWAVRDGDVAAQVPAPAGIFLLGSALLGLVAGRRRLG